MNTKIINTSRRKTKLLKNPKYNFTYFFVCMI